MKLQSAGSWKYQHQLQRGNLRFNMLIEPMLYLSSWLPLFLKGDAMKKYEEKLLMLSVCKELNMAKKEWKFLECYEERFISGNKVFIEKRRVYENKNNHEILDLAKSEAISLFGLNVI